MRTAEDYVKMYADFRNDLNMTDSIKLLVEAVRIEAIKECAQRARITKPIHEAARLRLGNYAEEYVKNNPQEVDEQSILSLIKELK